MDDNSPQTLTVSDADTFCEDVLQFLATTPDSFRVLRVEQHTERRIEELILCHRKCNTNPTRDQKERVSALSGGQEFVLAFSGESCHEGEYVGRNLWGKGFDDASTYCPLCGYAMTGPEIHEVVIVRGDKQWTKMMREQCEFGEVKHSISTRIQLDTNSATR